MQSYKVIPKLLLELFACLICLYVIAYPCLRVSRILIARNYFVYKTIEEGGQLIEDHFDIDHGPAMVYGRIQQRTFLGVMYKPLSLIEVYLRGYGNYPRVWIAEEFICNQ
ncbi:MAG: hypothetical protein JW787_08685 [Sedimentisphaerales bacterium]|nr:hypothetical protein [Sedimentisphaerales bacterium]